MIIKNENKGEGYKIGLSESIKRVANYPIPPFLKGQNSRKWNKSSFKFTWKKSVSLKVIIPFLKIGVGGRRVETESSS